MDAGESNKDRANEKYSKIDLEDIDSWLPPEVGQSIARMIASRNRKQCGAGLEAGDSVEWEDMPQVGRDYHALLVSNSASPDPQDDEEPGSGEPTASRLDEGRVKGQEEPGDSPGDEIPFYY